MRQFPHAQSFFSLSSSLLSSEIDSYRSSLLSPLPSSLSLFPHFFHAVRVLIHRQLSGFPWFFLPFNIPPPNARIALSLLSLVLFSSPLPLLNFLLFQTFSFFSFKPLFLKKKSEHSPHSSETLPRFEISISIFNSLLFLIYSTLHYIYFFHLLIFKDIHLRLFKLLTLLLYFLLFQISSLNLTRSSSDAFSHASFSLPSSNICHSQL